MQHLLTSMFPFHCLGLLLLLLLLLIVVVVVVVVVLVVLIVLVLCNTFSLLPITDAFPHTQYINRGKRSE